jgi:hypothetical protein
MENIPLLSVVATLDEVPKLGLVRGQVGTVVEILAPDIFEVEFSDDSGRTYASLPMKAERLIVLHHQPVTRAA